MFFGLKWESSNCSCVSTIVWLHLLNFYKIPRENVRKDYTKIFDDVLNKSWKQFPIKQQVKRCWKSKDELFLGLQHLETPMLADQEKI